VVSRCEDAAVPVPGVLSTHRLAGPGPHDPARLLTFLGAHAVPGVESWDGNTYRRVLDLPGGPALAAVSARDRCYEVTLRVADRSDEETAVRRLAGLLAVEQDVTAGERLLARDPLLAPLVAARPGLRLPGSVDHAETLVRTVLGQQVSLAGARAAAARLVAAHGESLPTAWRELAPGLRSAWPRPAVLAALDPADPALAMPATRARTVVTVAAAVVAAGDRLPLTAQLQALPGVGPWTSDYVDLRCRADPDVFLPGDLGVRRALERLDVPAAPREAAALAARWAPYRSLSLAHLWAAYLDL
jgi:AraC family transcriptional regulator of adaptative response / DNA-3-methyladenine glycosylase II